MKLQTYRQFHKRFALTRMIKYEASLAHWGASELDRSMMHDEASVMRPYVDTAYVVGTLSPGRPTRERSHTPFP